MKLEGECPPKQCVRDSNSFHEGKAQISSEGAFLEFSKAKLDTCTKSTNFILYIADKLLKFIQSFSSDLLLMISRTLFI